MEFGRSALLVLTISCLPLAAAVFEGRAVEDHNGNPLSRVEIRITRPGTEAIVAELETDSQGRFRTPELPDTPYLIRFSKTNFSTLEVTTAPRAGMQMRLVHFGAISGHVFRLDGSPALDFQKDSVFAVTPSGAKAGICDRNARAGEYRIYGLLPGRYRVAITDIATEDGRVGQGILYQPNSSQPREYAIAGGEDYAGADINLPVNAAYTVSGKVEIDPQSTAQVSIVPLDFPSINFGIGGQAVPTFSIPNLLPGNYVLLGYGVYGDTHLFARLPVSVSAANVEGIVLPINQSRSTTLTLKAAESCHSSVTVELTAAEPWPTRKFPGTLQTGKPVTLERIPPSKYTIAAKSLAGDCFALAPPFVDLTRESSSKPVEVLLQPAGSIRGRITGAGPVSQYLAVLIAPDGSQLIAFPDDKGQFTFAHLRPGPYTPIAAGAATRWMPTEEHMPPAIEVASGAPTAVELETPEAHQ
jgi:hypothetical protein